MAVGCIQNIISIRRNTINMRIHLTEIARIALLALFYFIAISLKGNVATDMQYLLLRTFQGFDSTYLYRIILSLIGYIVLLCKTCGWIGNK